MSSGVRFAATAEDLSDDVWGPDSPSAPVAPVTQEDYTPWDERELSVEEQEMFDQLVREEMGKLDSEFREQAQLGAVIAAAEAERQQEMNKLALAQHEPGQQQQQQWRPTPPLPQKSSSHHLLPDPGLLSHSAGSASRGGLGGFHNSRATTTASVLNAPVGGGGGAGMSQAELKLLSAPVTILTAKKQKAPSTDPVFVSNTILSGIGAASRRAEKQKLSKRSEFMRLVAADEEQRLALRATMGEDGGKAASRILVGKDEREALLDEMLDGAETYSSRWDTMGVGGGSGSGSPNTKRLEALARKRQSQKEYAELLKAQQEVHGKLLGGGGGGNADYAGVSLSLPTEVAPPQPAVFNDGKTRYVSRFKASAAMAAPDQDFGEKRRKQLEYHEQLAHQISGADHQQQQQQWQALPPSPRRSAAAHAHAPATPSEPSLLDNIGSTNYARSDAALKRQHQRKYHEDLAVAAALPTIAAERVSLIEKYRTISKTTEQQQHQQLQQQQQLQLSRAEPTATSIGGIGGDAAGMDRAQALALKRQQQQEYARQIQESSTKVPPFSPRSSLQLQQRSHRQLSVAGGDSSISNSSSGNNESGPSALLAKGLASMGPSTTLMLKRAQQEQYKASLESDQAMRAIAGGDLSDGSGARASLRRQQQQQQQAQQQQHQPTGLLVGPDIGTATRHAINQRRQEDYARELAFDKTTPAIPTLRVPIQKPASACSPRPGEEEHGYFNIGTSIQVGVSTAVQNQRAKEKQISYQRQLDADADGRGAKAGGLVRLRRQSPPRQPAYPESANPSHNTLQLHNARDVDTARLIQQRQIERQKYIAMLEAAKTAQPIAQSRVPLASTDAAWGGGAAINWGGGGGDLREPVRQGIQRRATSFDYQSRAAEEGGW